jgi:plasmid maintenance system antidote protein VapI
MDATRVQTEVFNHIKASLPAHLALVDVISETLDLSHDSAYRRIRGEKPVTLEEIAKLAQKFGFSVDRFLGLESESYIFTGKLANAHDHVFDKWMEETLMQYQYMSQSPYTHVYYSAKDLPIHHFFQTPELASFKFFFWQKSILQYNELRGMKYKLGLMEAYSKSLADNIINTYNKVHSSEIWAVETINSTLRQIEYYHTAGIFNNKADPGYLCDSLESLINHLELQAEEGIKFPFGKSPVKGNGKYHIYNNELIVGNNNAIIDLGDVKITYLNHTSINYISTRDRMFNEYQLSATLNMINKSEPLHTVNEKGRIAFFNRLRKKIDNCRIKVCA